MINNGNESVRYVVAATPAEFEMVDQLWREVYVEERRWLPPEPKNIYADKYHPHSAYLLAIKDETPIGTMRIVLDSQVGLPIEQFFVLGPLKESQKFAESQRLIVSPTFRNRKVKGAPYGMWAALIKACVHYCFLHRVSYVLADVFTDAANLPMVEKFERIGFHKIGCPFQDTELDAPGSSIAMLLTLSQLLARVYTSPSPFFEYLLQFDPAFAFYRTNGEILLREGASIADVQTMTVAS
ncbi:MAG TPA: GNAT family N-acetyltransferase [Pyrinomonadaceae bacterium]|nr:GNAT family N-acetyltransferase [Pyrinomonadaceae bacterium]